MERKEVDKRTKVVDIWRSEIDKFEKWWIFQEVDIAQKYVDKEPKRSINESDK